MGVGGYRPAIHGPRRSAEVVFLFLKRANRLDCDKLRITRFSLPISFPPTYFPQLDPQVFS